MLNKYSDAILINRNYALFMGGSFFSATGTWFLSVAIGWLVWDIGRSEFLLGASNFAQMAPLLALGLIGGAIADRMDRRQLLLIAQVIMIAATGGLAVVSAAGFVSIPTILALLFVVGINQAFAWPTWSPFIADLVGPERLRSAVALNSARFNLTRIFGPALAGVLLAELGPAPCLAIAAATQVVLLLALLTIRTEPRERTPGVPLVAAIREGLHHVWHTPTVREAIIVATIVGAVVMPYVVFLPAFAQNILHIGAEGLGLLFTFIGGGAIAAATFAGGRRAARNQRSVQGLFTVVAGVCLAIFAVSKQPVLSSIALLGLGFGSIGFMIIANAAVQLAVPKEVVGRVIGVWVVVNAGTTPIGSVVLGALAERVGLDVTLAAAGLLAALVCGAILFRPTRPQVPTLVEESKPQVAG
ncbi:MAG: MFS transporter [Chloroflexota bacterium]